MQTSIRLKQRKFKRILLLLILALCVNQVKAKHRVLLVDSELPMNQREAIIFLTGFGSVYHLFSGQKRALKNDTYDVYAPDYISRKSINQSVENLREFITEYPIEKYKKVHVIAFIYGSWTLNTFLQTDSISNLSSVVYDRSPIQEQVPFLLHEDKPFFGWILFGNSLADLAQTPFPDVNLKEVNTGLMIESNVTSVAHRYLNKMELNDAMWNQEKFSVYSDDFIYVEMNHDDMYTDMDGIIDEVFYLFQYGRFPKNASKEIPSDTYN